MALFRHLDAAASPNSKGELEWFALPGGAVLFEFGEESDALFVLKSGSLGAFKPDASGRFMLDGIVAAGETVGELGLIVDQPRSATVRALRDSELLRLSRRGFMALVEHHPEAMLTSARLAVQRLIARSVQPLTSARTFTAAARCRRRCAACRAVARSAEPPGSCGDRRQNRPNTSAWFAAIEARNRFVIYLADAEQTDWRELCVRQADSFRAAANADSAAQRVARIADAG